MSQQIQFSCFFCYNQMICSLRETGHHSSNRLKNNLLACLKQSVNYRSSVEQAPATYSFFPNDSCGLYSQSHFREILAKAFEAGYLPPARCSDICPRPWPVVACSGFLFNNYPLFALVSPCFLPERLTKNGH